MKTPISPFLLSLAALTPAGLVAQDATSGAKPEAALVRSLDAFSTPLAHTEGGRVSVSGRDYKAEIEATGMRFVPFLGSDAPRDLPLEFRLRSVRVSDSALRLAATEPKLRGNTIECVRDACVETFRIDPHGIEQAFRFDQLPARGGMRIDLDVHSEFRGETREDGVHFVHELGGVRYGRAVAIDAKGDRLDLETSFDGDGIHIEVPELFVANAELPLVVDPLVSTLYSISSTQITRSVDLSYDRSIEAYVMVWERVYSATDSDVYAVPLDHDLAQIGSILVIDVSVESWQHCRVANFGFFDRFVVVASRNATGQDPYVAGKLIQGGPAWSVGAAFDIDSPATTPDVGPRLNPVVAGEDVGGSPNTAAVAWEYHAPSMDPEIRVCFIRQDGSLHPTGPFSASQSGDHATQPELCDTIGPSSPQHYRFGLAYRRTYQVGVNTAYQLRFATLVRGNFGATQVGPLMTLMPDSGYSVSAVFPDGTQFGACMVAADVLDPATGSRDIVARMVSLTNGNIGPQENLTTLESLGAAHVSKVQRNPRITTDGCRFAIAYQNDWTALDADVRAMTVAWQPSGQTTTFVVHDTDIIANSISNETAPAIACGRDGVDAARCAVAWSFASSTPTFTVQRQAYDAMAALGGYTSRATGCGGLAITPSGVPAIGHAIAMDLPASNGLTGFLVGVPVQIALGACPGCTLGADGTVFQGGSLSLTVPCLASLVGGTVAFQGFDTASPSCLGLVRLSDTIDMRVR